MDRKRVLIVGAGGFVGGYLIEEALAQGYEVWAGIRATTVRDRLPDPRIKFVIFDYDDSAQIVEALQDALDGERWEYIIYNLGATKVQRYSEFNKVNYEYIRKFTGALHHADKVPDMLVYISSLSVLGPQIETTRSEYTENMIPQPNTRYGASKLKAELWLATSGIPYCVVRATGVYGPWDKDYFLMVNMIDKGFDFGVGFRKQVLTFIYAADLAKAVFAALERGKSGEVYHITEPVSYTQKDFRRIVKDKLGKKFVMPVRLPLWMAKVACSVMEKLAVVRGKTSTLNSDKYKILKQRNWRCSASKAREDLGFEAQTSLEEGMSRTIDWYEHTGMLKKKEG